MFPISTLSLCTVIILILSHKLSLQLGYVKLDYTKILDELISVDIVNKTLNCQRRERAEGKEGPFGGWRVTQSVNNSKQKVFFP